MPVLLVILLQVAIGVVLGYIIAYITCSETKALKFLITSLSFTQTKTLKLLVVDNFAEAFEEISEMSGLHFSTNARNRALNYVLLSYLIENLLRFSLGAYLLSPGEDEIDEQKGMKYRELTGDEESDSRDVEITSSGDGSFMN